MANFGENFRVNLLPKTSFEFSSLGKFLSWAMTSGRVLVVLTEFVVLLSFGSRFYFDKKINDLSEVIDQKIAQIDSFQEIETSTRTLLAKQKPVLDYLDKNIKFQEKYDTLSKTVPRGVTMEKVYIDQNSLRLTGKAETEYSFAKFLANIKRVDNLAYLNIRDTNFDQNTKSVSFTIQATYK